MKILYPPFNIPFLVLVLCFLTCSGFTENVITLEEACKRTYERSNTLKLVQTQIENARLTIKEAYSNLWPKITGSGNYTRFPEEISFEIEGKEATIQPESAKSLQLSLEQPLFEFRVKYLSDAAKYNLAAHESQYMFTLETILRDVSNLYFLILLRNESVEIVKESLNALKEQLKLVVEKYNVGEIPETSLLETEYEVEKLELDLLNEKNSLDNLKNSLGIYMNVYSSYETVSPDIPLIKRENLQTPDYWLKLAFEKRSDLREQIELIQSYQAVKKSIKADFLPSFSAFANVDHNLDPTAFSPDETTWMAGVRFQWNIFERGSRLIQLKQARNQIQIGELNEMILKDNIRNNILRTLNELEAILKKQGVHDRQLKLANKNYLLRKEQFNVGFATSTDLLDAHTFLYSSKLSKSINELQLMDTYFQLLRESGTFLDFLGYQRKR